MHCHPEVLPEMSRLPIERIVGSTIDLLEIEPAHFEKVVAWRNDPQNRRFFFSQRPFTLEGQQRWYESYRKDPTDYMFIIARKDGSPVGTVSLYAVDNRTKSAEFGRMLIGEKGCRRLGIGTEACRLCLDYGFGPLGLQQIHLCLYQWNNAAISIYKKFGFAIEQSMSKDIEGIGPQVVNRMTVSRDRYASDSLPRCN